MLDRHGVPIRKWGIITYPVRAKSTMWMADAVVIDVQLDPILEVKAVNGMGREVTLTNPDRITVLPHLDFGHLGLTADDLKKYQLPEPTDGKVPSRWEQFLRTVTPHF